MKRKVVLAALAAVLLLGSLAAAYRSLRPKEASVSEEAVARITPGMSEQEVENIFGGPAGDYTYGSCVPFDWFHVSGRIYSPFNPDPGRSLWLSREGAAWVHFDTERRVRGFETQHAVETMAYYLPVVVVKENWLERIQRWLGL
jgi:hypothetical protein